MPDVPGPDQGLDLFDLMRGRGNADADELGKEWASHRGALPRQLPARSRARPDAPVPGPDVGALQGEPAGGPDGPPRGVHLRQRHQPARRLARGARRQPGQGDDGLARPHAVVPPALPRRRVVALRPVVPERARRPRAWPSARSTPSDGTLVATAAPGGRHPVPPVRRLTRPIGATPVTQDTPVTAVKTGRTRPFGHFSRFAGRDRCDDCSLQGMYRPLHRAPIRRRPTLKHAVAGGGRGGRAGAWRCRSARRRPRTPTPTSATTASGPHHGTKPGASRASPASPASPGMTTRTTPRASTTPPRPTAASRCRATTG